MPWWHKKKGSQGHAAAPPEYRQPLQQQGSAEARKPPSMATVAKALLVTRRRLRLTPSKRLHFLCVFLGGLWCGGVCWWRGSAGLPTHCGDSFPLYGCLPLQLNFPWARPLLQQFFCSFISFQFGGAFPMAPLVWSFFSSIDEPGKQVSSAVKIKNTSSSFVAFKFQTNAPKSCFMRPPSGILTPGESVITSVVKFIEPPEQQKREKKIKEKFKIVSLKVKQGSEFTPELFEEQKEFVVLERVLEVVFLDPESKSPEIEKLQKRLAEAEAAQQARKKPLEDKVQKTVAAGGVLDEWKEQQREKQLAV